MDDKSSLLLKAQEFVSYMVQKIQLLKNPSPNGVPKELIENWSRFETLHFEVLFVVDFFP